MNSRRRTSKSSGLRTTAEKRPLNFKSPRFSGPVEITPVDGVGVGCSICPGVSRGVGRGRGVGIGITSGPMTIPGPGVGRGRGVGVGVAFGPPGTVLLGGLPDGGGVGLGVGVGVGR